LAFDHLAIGTVAGGYNKVLTVNTSGEHLTDFPPTNMEAVDPHFECLKPFFNQVSVRIITPTAES